MKQVINQADEETQVESPFVSIPVEIVVSVGKTKPLIGDLLKMSENSVLHLDKKITDPVDLYVGDQLIAKGLLEENGEENGNQISVRLTEVISQTSGLFK